MAASRMVFNPPPNWPLPRGFTPPPGWQPDTAWGPPPDGWPLWLEKKSYVVRNVLLGILAVVVVCIGGCVALLVAGVIGAGDERENRERAIAKTCEGKTYADQQSENDHCADQDGRVSVRDVVVSATALRRDAQQNICTDVAYQNNGEETIAFNELDWRIQAPSGEVQNNLFAGSGTLGSGDLVSGGHKAGTVCFDPLSGSGQFVLIYKPSVWSGERGIWLYQL